MTSIEASVSKGWLARELGVAFDREYYLDPHRRREIDRRCHDYTRRELADLEIFHTESNLGRRRHHREAQVLIGGIQPNMILGMLLGAELVPHADMDADISPRCLQGRNLAELPPPETLLDHPLIRAFDAQIEALGAGLQAIPPFWWDDSGRPAIHGALTTGQKLVGDSFLMELLLDPGGCRSLMDWIVDAYVVLLRHFATVAGATIDHLHVGECSACLVSAKVFAELIAPTVRRLGQVIGPVRLHCCGDANHLVPEFARIAEIASLDLGGETSLALVRRCFGAGFPISIAPLATDLSRDGAEPVLAWADRVLEDNGGGELVVLYHLEPGYDLSVVRALHTYLSERSHGHE